MGFIKIPATAEKKYIMVNADNIDSRACNFRKAMDEYGLWELCASIRENGILQPISVRKTDNNKFELVAGLRRLKAAKMAGLKLLPCIVTDVGDKQAAVFSLIENLQRCDLSPFEQAEALAALIARFGMSQNEICAKLGLAQSTLANKLRLLKLSTEHRVKITAAGLGERHARAFLRIEDTAKREEALNAAIAGQLSAAQTEKMVEKMLSAKEKTAPVRPCAVGDMRLFVNSLNKLVGTLESSGISTKLHKKETAEYTEYTVRIQKQGHPLQMV